MPNFDDTNVSLTKKEEGFVAVWKMTVTPRVAGGGSKNPLPNFFFNSISFFKSCY